MTAHAYRAPILGPPDPLLRRTGTIAAVAGVLLLAVAWFTPTREVPITQVDEVPERLARLILEKPVPPASSPSTATVLAPKIATPPPVVAPEPTPRRRAPARTEAQPKLAENRGEAGRDRARQEVRTQLADVTNSLQEVVSDLSTALASTDDGARRSQRPARRRRARSGRTTAQLAGVGAGPAALSAGVAASAFAAGGPTAGITVQSIGDLAWAGDDPARSDQGTGPARSELRSDRSLLGVVRRYAPGIRYCYDNELKKQPALGGKLVVSITVAASGRVTEAVVVQDSVGRAALTACALTQIEAWRFPEIPTGVVTFHAPFVFTPPE